MFQIKRKLTISFLALAIVAPSLFLLSCSSAETNAASASMVADTQPTPAKAANRPALDDREFDGVGVVKTEAEWKEQLTKEQYHILREEGTERAYSGALNKNKEHGHYYCAACGLVLFSSKTKFESGTGWPSFYQPLFKKNVTEKVDRSLGETRTEVECARCGSHLGHVFDDGPEPTGLRYCMNSASLEFRASAKK